MMMLMLTCARVKKVLVNSMLIITRVFQGPPGKDGLPGHPGQRGETVRHLSLEHKHNVLFTPTEDKQFVCLLIMRSYLAHL